MENKIELGRQLMTECCWDGKRRQAKREITRAADDMIYYGGTLASLLQALGRWVKAGEIDRQQAEAIALYYENVAAKRPHTINRWK